MLATVPLATVLTMTGGVLRRVVQTAVVNVKVAMNVTCTALMLLEAVNTTTVARMNSVALAAL